MNQSIRVSSQEENLDCTIGLYSCLEQPHRHGSHITIYIYVDLLFQCAITLAISGGMHRDFAVGLILLSGSCC